MRMFIPFDVPRKRDSTQRSEAQIAIDAHLAARGRDAVWLIRQLGMTNGSYYAIWARGSERYDFLKRIAAVFGISVVELLSPPKSSATGPAPPTSMAAEPIATYQRKRYLEDRIADLEEKVAALERKKQ